MYIVHILVCQYNKSCFKNPEIPQPYSFIRNIHPYSFLETFTPTRLLDTYSPLLVYYISRKIPAYSLIRAYSFIRELRVFFNRVRRQQQQMTDDRQIVPVEASYAAKAKEN